MWFMSSLRHPTSKRAPRARTPRRSAGGFRPHLEALDDRLVPAQVSLTVSSLADAGPGTLRAAILTADAGKASDKFTIGFGVTGTIDLQTPLPDLNNNIAIEGPGASTLTVERAAGASFNRAIFYVDPQTTASLSGLTIANGNNLVSNNTIGGGGVANDLYATLTISGCAISGNSAASNGGGIYNAGTLTINGSTVSGNFAAFGGGGIANGGALTISNSTVSGNSTPHFGGGISSGGTLSVTGSTISGNSAGTAGSSFVFSGGGGGIASSGTLSVTGSTISGNSAGVAGSVFATGGGISMTSGTVTGSTISGNVADAGAGMYTSLQYASVVSGSTLSGNVARFIGGGIFNQDNHGTVALLTVTDSTLAGNSATGEVFQGFPLAGAGGAILNQDTTLVIRSCTIADNSAAGLDVGGRHYAGKGGGIDNIGVTTIRDSLFARNSADLGGAVYNYNASPLDVYGSTFTGNTAGDSGGGIYNLGAATLRGCTLSGNSAGSAGGGISNGTSGTLRLQDSTVTGNAAPSGADLFTLGAVTLDDSTVGVIGP